MAQLTSYIMGLIANLSSAAGATLTDALNSLSATSLFSTVSLSASTAISATPASMVRVDGSTAAADVVVTLPGAAAVGQVIGVLLATADDVHVVSFAGPVDATVPPLFTAGDWALFVWDGATWEAVGYDVAPGVLDALGGTAVGLYRLFNATATTDYSGNARSLTMGTVRLGSGRRVGTFALRSPNAVATQADPAFRLQAAMSLIGLVHCNVFGQASTAIWACGTGGGVVANNLQWSLGADGAGSIGYLHNTGAGVAQLFTPAGMAPLALGWSVVGFTRSAGGVVRIYLNGILVATSGALALPTGGTSASLGIGAYSSGSNPATAFTQCQVGIYSTELSAAAMLTGARRLLGAHR